VPQCPFGALTVRTDIVDGNKRETIIIDAIRCEGCGVCMAVCPRDGIEIGGYTLGELKAQADALITRPAPELEPYEPRIIAFCCNWCSYAAADTAGVYRMQYPTNVGVLRVMCAGMVHPDLVVGALERGADGVMVMGCLPGECQYRGGNSKAQSWAEGIRLALKTRGIDQERFIQVWLSAADGPLFGETVIDFTARIRRLGPNTIGTSTPA